MTITEQQRKDLNTLIDRGDLGPFQDYVETKLKCDQDLGSGRTLLHWCAEANRPSLIKYLISRGADVNAEAEGGIVPLYTGIHSGSFEAVEALLIGGADAFANGQIEMNAIDYATALKRERIQKLLETYEANKNYRT